MPHRVKRFVKRGVRGGQTSHALAALGALGPVDDLGGQRNVAFAIREVQVSGARNADDVLFRRLRLGQMNTKRTEELRGPVQAAIDKELKK